MNNSSFNDPLDELMNKHKAANGETVEIPLAEETPEEEPAVIRQGSGREYTKTHSITSSAT